MAHGAIVFGLTRLANAAKTVPLTPAPDVSAARSRVESDKNGNNNVKSRRGTSLPRRI